MNITQEVHFYYFQQANKLIENKKETEIFSLINKTCLNFNYKKKSVLELDILKTA